MTLDDLKIEYDKYRLKQDKIYVSDYDKFIEEIKMLENNKKSYIPSIRIFR
jgi:hypothetical protein